MWSVAQLCLHSAHRTFLLSVNIMKVICFSHLSFFCHHLICFSVELFSVSKDKSVHLMDVEEGKLVTRITKAHRYYPLLTGIKYFSSLCAWLPHHYTMSGFYTISQETTVVIVLNQHQVSGLLMCSFVLWDRVFFLSSSRPLWQHADQRPAAGGWERAGYRGWWGDPEGVGYEEGHSLHGAEAPRGLHQRHRHWPGQKNASDQQVKLGRWVERESGIVRMEMSVKNCIT